MGSFLEGNSIECKVGYSVDLQFNLNTEDYFFISLEAVASANEEESRSDFVEFTIDEAQTNRKDGVYKIKVKLLNPASDILIKPDCFLLPYIKDHSPNSKNLQTLDTPIIINFNTAVEDMSVKPEKSLFNYDNISLTYIDASEKLIDMSDYFFFPEFNEDKTSLILYPKGAELKVFLQNENIQDIEINVSFFKKEIVQNNGQNFSLKDNSNLSFIIHYNSELEDSVPPERKDFFVTRERITISSAAEANQKYIQKTYNQLEEQDLLKNLAPASFYIYGKFQDNDSGVRFIQVNEQFITDSKGAKSAGSILSSYYTASSNGIEFIREKDGITYFLINYTLQETLKDEPSDGFFELTVAVIDGSGNVSEEKLCLINLENSDFSNIDDYDKANNGYHNLNALAGTLNVYNTVTSKFPGNNARYDFSKYNTDIKTIRIKDEYKPSRFYIKHKDTVVFITCNDVEYYCEYNHKKTKFPGFSQAGKERCLFLEVNSVTDLSFTISAVYNDLVIGKKEFHFPPAVTVTSSMSKLISLTSGILGSLSSEEYKKRMMGIIKFEDGSYNFLYCESTILDPELIPDGTLLYVGYMYNQIISEKDYVYENGEYSNSEHSSSDYILNSDKTITNDNTQKYFAGGLLGEVAGPFYKNQDGLPSLNDLALEWNYDIAESSQPGYFNFIIKTQEAVWEKYEFLNVCLVPDNNPDSSLYNSFFYKNQTFKDSDNNVCCAFSVPSSAMLETKYDSKKLSCMGVIKDSIFGRKIVKSITYANLSQEQKNILDQIPPGELTYKGMITPAEKVIFKFRDIGTGPSDTNDIKINGKPLDTTWVTNGDDAETEIPIKCFKWGDNIISYDVKDIKGFHTKGSISFNPNIAVKYRECDYDCRTTSSRLYVTMQEELKDEMMNNPGRIYICRTTDGTSWTTTSMSVDNMYRNDGYTWDLPLDNSIFYRVLYSGLRTNYNNSVEFIYDNTIRYAKTYSGTGKYNYIFPNGSNKDSVVISSDAEVLVSVCATKLPLSICNNWTTDVWELMADYKKQTVVSFNTSQIQPQVYDIPDDVPDDSCYCVIVHYANNKTSKSNVMQNKE